LVKAWYGLCHVLFAVSHNSTEEEYLLNYSMQLSMILVVDCYGIWHVLVCAHKTSLALALFIDMPAPHHESERSYISVLGVSMLVMYLCVVGHVFVCCWSYICVLGVSMLSLSTVFLLNIGTVPTMYYFFNLLFNAWCIVIFTVLLHNIMMYVYISCNFREYLITLITIVSV